VSQGETGRLARAARGRGPPSLLRQPRVASFSAAQLVEYGCGTDTISSRREAASRTDPVELGEVRCAADFELGFRHQGVGSLSRLSAGMSARRAVEAASFALVLPYIRAVAMHAVGYAAGEIHFVFYVVGSDGAVTGRAPVAPSVAGVNLG
jgi:hypothetical protein